MMLVGFSLNKMAALTFKLLHVIKMNIYDLNSKTVYISLKILYLLHLKLLSLAAIFPGFLMLFFCFLWMKVL